MRMFLSVSMQSSELSLANHSSRPTVSQLKCVSWHYIKVTKLRITNHRRQKYPPLFTLLSFETRNKWPLGWPQPQVSFPRVFFQLQQFLRQRPNFSAHRAALMTKTDLIIPAFSSRFVDFAVQFCFRSKFLFQEERHASQVWQWRDSPGPIKILCYT